MVAISERHDEFFIRASWPHTNVRDYLSFLTEYALRVTRSRVGFLALDSLSGGQPRYDIGDVYTQSYLITSQAERGLPRFPPPVREVIKNCMKSGTAADNHYCIMTSAGLSNILSNQEETVEFILRSASSVWIQLSDGHSPMGWLGLAADEQDAYTEGLLESLNAKMSQGMVALNRLLLREHAKKNCREIYLVGRSPKLLDFEQKLKKAASHNCGSVLIRGERGSGKELAAYGIHYFSKRREGPFVSVLAPAIAESLQVDELFGHERNSFTGAARSRKGKFLAAEGGTVFLDEVGDLTPTLQFTLLRVVEHGEIQPVGRDFPINVDVRVVTATNMDPDQLIAEGRLRGDLFDRLNVIELTVPPLRERREDIPLLIRYFLRRECEKVSRRGGLDERLICQSCGRDQIAVCASEEFYDAMQGYDWPGNIRELENLMTRLATMAKGEVLRAHHLPERIIKGARSKGGRSLDDFSLDMVVKRHIEKVLALADNNQVQAARMLGVARTTLQAKMRKLNISRVPQPDFICNHILGTRSGYDSP